MGKTFAMLFVSFIAVIIINFSWGIVNLYFFIFEGFQTIVVGSTFVENIALSTYLKWILLIDVLWIIFALAFVYGRKSYKSDPSFHLTYNKIEKPGVCVVIPSYNEEESIERVSSSALLESIKNTGLEDVFLAKSNAQAYELIENIISKEKGVLLIQGAGNISEISDKLSQKIK